MKFFDVHLHLPTPDEKGLEALMRHLESEPGMVGGNLILNTREEVDFAYRHLEALPPSLNLIPYYSQDEDFPVEFKRSGWYKIHPHISRITLSDIDLLRDSIVASPVQPRGIIVHCYPWGAELEYSIGLPLVIELAKALPGMLILAAHGGGYESWAFRSHAGVLKNVFFDFSVTMSYYLNSDILRPFQRYLRYSPDRILFGSDWPSAQVTEQWLECVRLAHEIDLAEEQLETLFMANSRRLWPDVVS